MRKIVWLVALVISLAFAFNSMAKDGAEVYKENCVKCHGDKGQGMKGVAPPHKGNEFITKGSKDEVKAVVRDGRSGEAKKYKKFPLDMPKLGLSEEDIEAVVNFEQGDLQK
jgi:mono/diheme cytochrome c family protein